MDIFSIANKLDSQVWEKKADVPDDLSKLGYKEYHLTRCNIEEGTPTYYLSTDSGDVKVAKLNGVPGKVDPLKHINKCFLLIEENKAEELNDKRSPGLIKGIAIDDDWVESRR